MARARRKTRRSRTQSVASLLALGLPAPVQRIADTQIGAKIVFFGIPALLLAGLLQINWQNGRPRLTVNASKAQELREVAKEELSHLEEQATIQQWELKANDVWNAARNRLQQFDANQSSQPAGGYEQPVGYTNPNGYSQHNPSLQSTGSLQTVPSANNSRVPFPSTRPPQVSSVSSTRTPSNTLSYQERQPEQQAAPQQPTQQQLYQQQLYQQQLYQQQLYQQKLYQQQLYQEQLYQQQLYQQQMNRDQQLLQTWQAQQAQAQQSAQNYPATPTWQTPAASNYPQRYNQPSSANGSAANYGQSYGTSGYRNNPGQ